MYTYSKYAIGILSVGIYTAEGVIFGYEKEKILKTNAIDTCKLLKRVSSMKIRFPEFFSFVRRNFHITSILLYTFIHIIHIHDTTSRAIWLDWRVLTNIIRSIHTNSLCVKWWSRGVTERGNRLLPGTKNKNVNGVSSKGDEFRIWLLSAGPAAVTPRFSCSFPTGARPSKIHIGNAVL